jgi:hypothetical protein
MDEMLTRVWEDLVGRLSGPLTFRLLLQPAMALYFGIRDGLKDSREGRPAYLWTIFSEPAQRGYLLHEGWKAMVKVFLVAFVIDGIYQFMVFRWFYPGEAVITAFVLAFVPYLLIRGPVNRIARAGKILQKERTVK